MSEESWASRSQKNKSSGLQAELLASLPRPPGSSGPVSASPSPLRSSSREKGPSEQGLPSLAADKRPFLSCTEKRVTLPEGPGQGCPAQS